MSLINMTPKEAVQVTMQKTQSHEPILIDVFPLIDPLDMHLSKV